MEDSIWTSDALKEYVDSHLVEVRSEIKVRIDEKHREHDKFEREVHQALFKQNEFRGSLSDLGKTMATRLELDAIDDKITTRLGRAEGIQAKIVGALILISVVVMPGVVLLTFFLSR